MPKEESYHRFAEIIGCKWTLAILDAIFRGVNRPSSIQRELDGLSAKVLNERITKLKSYGLIDVMQCHEIRPRTEYQLSEIGKEFVLILVSVRQFLEKW